MVESLEIGSIQQVDVGDVVPACLNPVVSGFAKNVRQG